MTRVATLLLVLGLVLSGCAWEAQGGSEAEAAALASSFLDALRDQDIDTAWSLIHRQSRDEFFGDRPDRFAALVKEIDIADAHWEIREVIEHDGRYQVHFDLVPLVINDALSTFMQVIQTDGVPTHAAMQVRIDLVGGSRGVYAG